MRKSVTKVAASLVGGVLILTLGCGSKSSGKSPGVSSSNKSAVGSGDAGMPGGSGGGSAVNGGNAPSGCAEDESLDCDAEDTPITCWGDVYPDPGDWNCSDGVTEDSSGNYVGYCCY